AAQESYQQAFDLAQQINSTDDILNALMSLALVSERTGKLKEARDYADRTIAMAPAEGNRLDVLYPMLVKGHVAARLHDTAEAEKIFREIEQDKKSHVFLKWEAEHSLAQLYEDENQAEPADREYRAALSTFETARSSLKHEESELPFPANASRIYDDYIHFLVARGKTAEALQVAEYSRARTLAEGLNLLRKGTSFAPDPLNAQQVARQAGGAVLFYWLGEKQSYLWAITRQKTSLFSLPPESEIKAAVQRYGKALGGPQDVLDTANEDGRWLYRTLIAPAQAMLPAQPSGAKAHLICRSCGTAEAVPFPGSASVEASPKVVIVPDGSLNSLNFETLLVPEPKLHYWIEDATITNASSLRLLSATHTVGNKHNLLILGDAVSSNKDYPELPKAAVEMESIAKHFAPPQQQVFKREHANPPAYLASKPEQFSYIHFVAHGTASRLSPLDSAIVLSKATAADDSFKLYARDIIQHPLHAELVTISTCYGQGRAYSGEGMVGLSWAFLRAGAHNVIGALWEVSDASTPQLMDQLYGELKKGQTPDAALRAAKLSLLRSDSAFRRPFYWAPFQLYAGS
ncbi:MAG TPA: CHAT domain-containing tetratricopeptide repeat protein, partial [Terriglobales bacterium]